MTTTSVLQAFVTLFVIIDPVAVVPMFAALTSSMSPTRRRHAAFRAILVAFTVLFLFGLGGETFLRYSGISLDAFRIAGGLLLFLIAAEMLFEKRTQRRGHQTEETEDDPSIFPIGVPLVAGPGAMATMILLVSQDESYTWLVTVNVIMALVLLITLALFLAAGAMTRAMGKTGSNVLTRLFGILLAALAVQIVLDGLAGFGLSPVAAVHRTEG